LLVPPNLEYVVSADSLCKDRLNTPYDAMWFWWMSSHLHTEEGAVLEVIVMRSNQISGLVCFGLRTFFAAEDSSTFIKCDLVFKMCVNDPSSIHIPDN
jgi:hypothetical protein